MLRDSIRGTKMACVVVDPQRKFYLKHPDWESIRDSAVKNINRYTGLFRERGLPVIFIHFDGPTHEPYPGDDGDEWLQGIESSDSDIIVHKKFMSCFRQTDLEQILTDLNADCILLAGMLTEFCVISTYYSASERGIAPYMAKGALISYNDKGNEAAELICSTVEEDVLVNFLDGKQAPITDI